ncbi:MAG: hypothetical protein AAF959_29585 [Cyanobacteria bacterium P01_D01_bin.56]
MRRSCHQRSFFKLLGKSLKIYVFTALLLAVVSLIIAIFVSVEPALNFLQAVRPLMSKTGATLGSGIAIAIALESLAQ